jgi:hypothetical protein
MSLVKHRFRLRDGSIIESKDWYARFTYKDLLERMPKNPGKMSSFGSSQDIVRNET